MQLPNTLAWLLDAASAEPSADRFLAALGARLIADGVPLAGGALTLSAPHPIIARRTFLWRAESGAVIEALGFSALAPAVSDEKTVGRDWLAGLGTGLVEEDVAGPGGDGAAENGPVLGWALARPLDAAESGLLREAARFAAAPLSALAARSTLAALLEAYLGRRSAAKVLAGRLKRETGETIRAVLPYGDLRGFTELSERQSRRRWSPRSTPGSTASPAPHAFGGEVLGFIGDGVLAIFPIGDRRLPTSATPRSASSRGPRRHGPPRRGAQPAGPAAAPLRHGASRRDAVETSARPPGWTSPPSARPSTSSGSEGLCKALGESVLVSGAVAAETTMALVPLGDHALRGIAEPCAVFGLPED
jgi:class 3 adenylate cyclase